MKHSLNMSKYTTIKVNIDNTDVKFLIGQVMISSQGGGADSRQGAGGRARDRDGIHGINLGRTRVHFGRVYRNLLVFLM